jgi:hypothetical protein
MGQDFPHSFVSKTGLKREYGLTNAMIDRLGEPDNVALHHYQRRRQPVKLYRRDRVEEWISRNPDVMLRGEGRAIYRDLDGKTDPVRLEIVRQSRTLILRPLPPDEILHRDLRAHHMRRFGRVPREITGRALVTYIRHFYTNYDTILANLSGRVGKGELYKMFKLYLCCRIITHYQIDADPVFAAFRTGRSMDSDWPEKNLETYLRERLGIDE